MDYNIKYVFLDCDNVIAQCDEENLVKMLYAIAKFYIDDRSYANNKVPWRKIYKFLIKKYGVINNNNV